MSTDEPPVGHHWLAANTVKLAESKHTVTWSFGRQTPDNNLMRFVSKHFPSPTTFLDIGSGEGANARELGERGYSGLTIDADPGTDAQLHQDVCRVDFPRSDYGFDLIYDINTLCHVAVPPFEKIKGWLKPGGVFFSICPQFGSSSRIMEGKNFTRFLAMRDVEEFYGVFKEVKVGSSTYRLPGDEMYASWLVECRP